MSIEASVSAPKGIETIDNNTVHKICSGQVVLTLATALKELLENSLDAGATQIDIRLKEYGSELIEVIDDGHGVEEANFEGLTLKHHTSKLQEFSDLWTLDSFGFRGEALSSLCALSDLSIITCHKTCSVGTCLEFDNKGILIKRTPLPREVGTTVIVKNIFNTLPVRHKEFLRNLRREYAKMVHVISAYALIQTKVRISCTNQSANGKKITVLSTQSNSSVPDNITSVFGLKQVSSLLSFEQASLSEEIIESYSLSLSALNETSPFNIKGWISSCAHGQGRSSSDRQFFFINERPCDLVKVSKLVNRIYHNFNRHQYPFVLISINLEKGLVDVNVTPDKRKIFVENEKLLLATIEASLMQMFADIPSQLNHCLQDQKNGILTNFFTKETTMSTSKKGPLKRPFTALLEHKDSKPNLPSPVQVIHTEESCSNLSKIREQNLKPDTSKFSTEEDSEKGSRRRVILETECQTDESDSSDKSPFSTKTKQCWSLFKTLTLPRTRTQRMSSNTVKCKSLDQFRYKFSNSNNSVSPYKMTNDISVQMSEDTSVLTNTTTDENEALPLDKESFEAIDDASDNKKPSTTADENDYEVLCIDEGSHEVRNDSIHGVTPSASGNNPSKQEQVEESEEQVFVDEPVEKTKKCVNVNLRMDLLKERVMKKSAATSENEKSATFRKFLSKINPSENDSAEAELKKQIRKDNFEKMEVIGQFNLGFIITKQDSDLFIIDQHATDEKYNFEMLQRNTVLETQKLLQPLKLELTAVNESVLLDNIDVFHQNGFHFVIDEDALPGRRVMLSSVPVSKNWSFGKEDIDELLFLLNDSPGTMCRPSRVRQMFASRACRKSVMIGSALSQAEMKKLVCHMGQIEHPWNCPHGRPTIRHLFDLAILPH